MRLLAGNGALSIATCDFSTALRGEFAGPVVRQQIAPTGGVYVRCDYARPFDAGVIHRLLAAQARDESSGVMATVWEIFDGIYLWLALHAETSFQLGVAESRIGDIRCLLSMPGKLGLTAGLFDGDTMAPLSLGDDDRPATTWVMSDGSRFRFAVSARMRRRPVGCQV